MRRFSKFIIIVGFLLVFGFISAEASELETPLPGLGATQIPLLPDYIKYIFDTSLKIAGVIAFSVIVYAGFKFMASKGSPGVKWEARRQIISAFLGLAVLLFAYLIFTTINPQIISLQLPEAITLPPIELESFEPEPPVPLAYTEIPTGDLIADALSAARMNRIKSVLDSTKTAAQEVKAVANDLRPPVVCSSCGYKPDPTACNIGSTSAGCNTLSCSSGPCTGDPCPQRNLIEEKRQELQDALDELSRWLVKVGIEINGSEPEKIIGLQRELDDSKEGEDLAKNCALTPSQEQGKTQGLFGYSAFWQYIGYLKNNRQITGTTPYYFFDYLSPDNPYYATNFYCTEMVHTLPPGSASVGAPVLEQVSGLDFILPKQESKATCGQEIPLGQALDNTQELVQKIITALREIIGAVEDEIDFGEELHSISDPAGRCSASNCYSRTTCSCGACEEPEGGAFNPFMISIAFAADCCPCSVTVRPCGGQIFDDSRVNQLVQEIGDVVSEIEIMIDNLKDLINEIGIEDRLKISKIFDKLRASQSALGVCYNSKETLSKIDEAKEKLLLNDLYNCGQLKEFSGLQSQFYNEDGQEISQCYGGNADNPGLFDNLFCCQSEFSPN